MNVLVYFSLLVFVSCVQDSETFHEWNGRPHPTIKINPIYQLKKKVGAWDAKKTEERFLVTDAKSPDSSEIFTLAELHDSGGSKEKSEKKIVQEMQKKLDSLKKTRQIDTPPDDVENIETSQTLPISTTPNSEEAGTIIEEKTATTPKLSDASTSVTRTTTVKPPTVLYCLCDIHKNACDMNCCCDMDCNSNDREFFTHCNDQVTLSDDRSSPRRQKSCYKSFVTFKHYSSEIGVETDNGMLCILRDNNKADNILSDSKLQEIHERILKGEVDIKPKYILDRAKIMKYEKIPYKYGAPVLGIKNEDLSKEGEKNLVPYGLPATYHEASCSSIRAPIQILEPFHSNCSVRLFNLTQDCTSLKILNSNSFLKMMRVLKNPAHEDPEFLTISVGKSCNGAVCSAAEFDVVKTEFANPVFNKERKICQNVLSNLNLTFYIGLEGIIEIVADAKFQDVPMSLKTFVQTFNAKFEWNHDNETTENVTGKNQYDFPRSGNPGYNVGAPVIMGEKVPGLELKMNGLVEDSSTEIPIPEVESKEMVLVWKDPSQWLTLHSPGQCSDITQGSNRKSVRFDYSHLALCSVNLTKFTYCEDLQLHVAKILLGVEDPFKFDKRKWVVAAFGNSNPDTPSEWVPLTFKNFPIPLTTSKESSKSQLAKGCDSIVSSLRITIAYAFVGPIDFPQAKITGVFYEFGEPVSTTTTGNDLIKQFSVSTTVAFKDVTAPSAIKVAKWPVLSIRLPKDFFYPFS